MYTKYQENSRNWIKVQKKWSLPGYKKNFENNFIYLVIILSFGMILKSNMTLIIYFTNDTKKHS